MFVTPALQLGVGHVAARSTLSLERWSSTAAGPLFYEPTRDTNKHGQWSGALAVGFSVGKRKP